MDSSNASPSFLWLAAVFRDFTMSKEIDSSPNCEMRPHSDPMSYSSSCGQGQPPSIGDVRQINVSEASSSYQIYSDGQPPSLNDVGGREPSQSEALCTQYEGADAQEVQQEICSYSLIQPHPVKGLNSWTKRSAISRKRVFGGTKRRFKMMRSTKGHIMVTESILPEMDNKKRRIHKKLLKNMGFVDEQVKDAKLLLGYKKLKLLK